MSAAIPIFFINLKRSEDRLDAMRAHLRQLGLIGERFEAIDGRDLAEAAPGLTKSETACTLSHLYLIRYLLESEIPAAIILEDDADLTHCPIVPEIFERHGIVQLCGWHPDFRWGETLEFEQTHRWGTIGYAIDQKGMSDVVEHFFGPEIRMDRLGAADDCLYKATTTWSANQPLVYSRLESSTIHSDRDDFHFSATERALDFWRWTTSCPSRA